MNGGRAIKIAMKVDDYVSVYESIALFDDLFVYSGKLLFNHFKLIIAIIKQGPVLMIGMNEKIEHTCNP